MRLPVFLVLVFSLTFASCGPSEPAAEIIESVQAGGVVTYKGKPLENYRVTFYSVDGKRPASGLSDANGKFTLGVNGPDDGAPPGKHKVAFVYEAPSPYVGESGKEEYRPPAPPKVRLPEKF